jgi:hypothetical protein
MKKGLLIAALCLVPLAACTSLEEREGTPAPHIGDAVKRNILAQTVNPNAGEEAEGPQTADGRRAALAQERYATGKVIPPVDITSQQQGNGSNNSSGGSGMGSSATP